MIIHFLLVVRIVSTPKKRFERMSMDYASIIGALQQSNPNFVGIICTDESDEIVYYTDNLQPDPEEIKTVMKKWREATWPSVMFQGIKFSVLQATWERFIATNTEEQGHLVGSTTPEGQRLLGFVSPDAAYDVAYMDIARAAGELRPESSAAGLDLISATSESANEKIDLSSVQLEHAPAENPFARSDETSEDEQKGIEELKEALIAAGQYDEQDESPGLWKAGDSEEQ